MHSMMKQYRTALWALAAVLTIPLLASAQNNVFRGGNTVNSVNVQPRPNYNSAYRPSQVAPGYYPGTFYGANYGNSYSASLSGMADLTTAQGQYLNDWQSARMTNQSVEQEKLKTRKMAMELKAYEQSLIVPLEDIRDQERQRELRRAMGDPPVTEIYAATSLNNILKDIQDMQARGIQGPTVAIDPDILAHINVASPTGGNVGAFKNGPKPKWPLGLLDQKFAGDRKAVEDAMAAVVKQGGGGGIDGQTIKDYLDAVAALEATLESQAKTMSLSNIMAAKRQITELNDAGQALQGADPGALISQKSKIQGGTVAEVVAYMTKAGIKFGPATKGDEAAYKAFHYSLVSYDLGTRQAAAPQK